MRLRKTQNRSLLLVPKEQDCQPPTVRGTPYSDQVTIKEIGYSKGELHEILSGAICEEIEARIAGPFSEKLVYLNPEEHP